MSFTRTYYRFIDFAYAVERLAIVEGYHFTFDRANGLAHKYHVDA